MVLRARPLCPEDLDPLSASFDAVCHGYPPKLSLDPAAAGFVLLSDLTPGAIEALLEQALVAEPAGDRKLAAAYAIGAVSWSVCLTLAALAMDGCWIVKAPPSAVAIRPRRQSWAAEGAEGVFYLYDVALDFPAIEVTATRSASEFPKAIERLFAHPVAAMARFSGLSQAALWRLVADHIGEAFLALAQHKDTARDAIIWCREIFRDPATKLHNKQVDFAWVDVPEQPSKSAWMLRKGGCCRAYTLTGSAEDYCATCVLRDEASQIAKFQTYLCTL